MFFIEDNFDNDDNLCWRTALMLTAIYINRRLHFSPLLLNRFQFWQYYRFFAMLVMEEHAIMY